MGPIHRSTPSSPDEARMARVTCLMTGGHVGSAAILTECRQPEERINLAKACMHIALEDEATAAAQAARADGGSGGTLEPAVAGIGDTQTRDSGLGCSSSWDLSRLDALAAEVEALLDTLAGGLGPGGGAPDCMPAGTAGGGPQGGVPETTTQSKSRQAASDGFRDEDVGMSKPSPPLSGAAGAEGVPLPSGTTSIEPADPTRPRDSKRLIPRPRRLSSAAAATPPSRPQLLTLTAVNDVIFNMQGYRRMAAHGDPGDSHLPRVLERGTGTSVALSIVYLEVGARLGLRLQPVLLDDGRYVVLVPAAGRGGGQGAGSGLAEGFVVDAYGGGDLLPANEVFEDAAVDVLPRAATKRQLLAVLLKTLCDAHWAAAVRCKPEPGLMLPLSVDTAAVAAAEGLVPEPDQLAQAVAAAERRIAVSPPGGSAQLELGLLLYMGSRFGDAWQELSLYEEAMRAERASEEQSPNSSVCENMCESDDLQILITKARLMSDMAHW